MIKEKNNSASLKKLTGNSNLTSRHSLKEKKEKNLVKQAVTEDIIQDQNLELESNNPLKASLSETPIKILAHSQQQPIEDKEATLTTILNRSQLIDSSAIPLNTADPILSPGPNETSVYESQYNQEETSQKPPVIDTVVTSSPVDDLEQTESEVEVKLIDLGIGNTGK